MSARPRAVSGIELCAFVLFALALVVRFLWLDRLPGCNGDEAYFGHKALQAATGDLTTMRTGSGRPISPFLIAPTMLLHALATPSFGVLRLTAALSGAATALFAWWAFARLYGRAVGLGLGLLCATLPLGLMYSRIYWDPCQSLLACLLCLYFARRRRPLMCAGMFACALVVHPTNFFLLPCLLAPLVGSLWKRLRTRHLLLGGSLLAALGLALVLIVGLDRLPRYLQLRGNPIARPHELWSFAVLWGDLLSGVTVYRFVVGSLPAPSLLAHRLLFGVLVLFLVVGNLRRRARTHRIGPKLAAFGAGLVPYYLLAGCAGVSPHFERYALWMLVPSLELLALLAVNEYGAVRFRRGALALAAVLLVVFCHHGLYRLTVADTPDRAFITGPVLPHQAALEALLAQTSGPLVVYAEDWWMYWPLRYLNPTERLRLTIPERESDFRFPADYTIEPGALVGAEVFDISFVDSLWDQHRALRPDRKLVHTVGGYPDNRSVIAIYRHVEAP